MNTPIDEPIHLEEYSETWPAKFASEAQRILACLEASPVLLEHIGSTAVPGLCAKPVIDIQVGVQHYPPPEGLVARLVSLGYENLAEADIAGRLYLRMRGDLAANVHVIGQHSSLWSANLALRNYLRSSAEAREAYAVAKRAAIAGGACNLLAYSAAKESTVRELVAHALRHQNAA